MSDRQSAVREAWRRERDLVRGGKGTRDWNPIEQKQLLIYGRVDGYDGHHMKSVDRYPEYAGSPENIQFLKSGSEHKRGAHGRPGVIADEYHSANGGRNVTTTGHGDTQTPTNGYYDPLTGQTHDFGDHKPNAPSVIELSRRMTPTQRSLSEKRELEVRREQAIKSAAMEARRERNQEVEMATEGHERDTRERVRGRGR